MLFRQLGHISKEKVRLDESLKHTNCFCACMQIQTKSCVFVCQEQLNEILVTEQLAKLDQWQCHSVHTPPSSHTYQLCFVLPHTTVGYHLNLYDSDSGSHSLFRFPFLMILDSDSFQSINRKFLNITRLNYIKAFFSFSFSS